MREYGVLQCSFWQSDDARTLSDAGKLLAAYLVTGPHSNGLGCYRLPDGYVMADFGWTVDKVTKAFEELSRNGFAYRFESVVFIPNFLRWNKIANPKVAAARQKEFEALPKGDAKSRVARALLEFGNHISDQFRTVLDTVSQTVSQTVSKQEQNRTEPIGTEPGRANGMANGHALQLNGSTANGHADLHEEIVAVYHEVLADLPGVKVWNDTRRRKLDARIADTVKRGKPADRPDYWREYFAKVARSDFLCGRKGGWRCPGLEWLVEESNFTKVIEGAYENTQQRPSP